MKVVGNSRFQKAANGSLLLNFLRKNGGTSRTCLAHNLGLQPSTVTYIVNRLLQAGLVVESLGVAPGSAIRGSGRRSNDIEINRLYGAVIGLDLQADYYKAVITDIAGGTLSTFHREYDVPLSSFEDLLVSVLGEIERTIPGGMAVLGAGIAIPGVVDPTGPEIVECWSHNLYGRNFGDFLKNTFPYPVLMENDANCCAWRKLWYGSSHQNDSFVYLLPRFHNPELLPPGYPSIGIGLGLVLNDEIYHGFTHRAGEFRSLFFKESGNVPGQISLTPVEMNSIREDESVRRKLVVELLRTMMLLMHIINPRALFIGGDLAPYKNLVISVLDQDLNREWNALSRGGFEIEVLSQAENDAAWGAAAAILDALYSIPQVGGREQDTRVWQSLLANLIDHA